MKIGTLSLNINTDDLNYGAMLHTWAFVEFIQKNKLADSIEVINCVTPRLEGMNRSNLFSFYLKKGKVKAAIKSLLILPSYRKRLQKFKKFVSDNLPVSEVQYTREQLIAAKLVYECLICESDVIWSPGFFGGTFDDSFFLAHDNMKLKKKIIYAASTANAEFDTEQQAEFSDLIKCPDSISCRELYGTELIHRCGRPDAVTVLDPVLLLAPSDYKKSRQQIL